MSGGDEWVEALSGGAVGDQEVQRIIDAIPARIGLLDAGGQLMVANAAWQVGEAGLCCAIGASYRAACQTLAVEGQEGSPVVAAMMDEILRGERAAASFVLPAQATAGARWYRTHFVALSCDSRFHAAVVYFDITDGVMAERRLYQDADSDGLTGLPDRPRLIARLTDAAEQARRRGTRLAALVVDLDHFDNINETLGSDAGDQLLHQFGQRLRETVRKSDIVGWLGGDEFAVILPQLKEPADAGLVAKKLLGRLAGPFALADKEVYCSASIGIAIFPDDASAGESLLENADAARLRARQAGGKSFQFFSVSMAETEGAVLLPAADLERQLRDRGSLAPEQIRPDGREQTLLLVDDEANILSSLRRLLRRDGYRILAAGSAAEGLDILALNPVDVIVSDQRMPAMTGVEFLRQVKTLYPDTVRMVLSGYTELQSITDAINEGAIYKFLTKPWDDEQLRANIQEAFRYKGLADENRRLASQLQVTNAELAHSNEQLRELLNAKQQRIIRDETTLGVVQDMLQQVPIPIIGIDLDGMVVFANEEAAGVLGDDVPLFGNFANECLPPALAGLLARPMGETGLWSRKGTLFRACCRSMEGEHGMRGKLLMLVPEVEGRE